MMTSPGNCETKNPPSIGNPLPINSFGSRSREHGLSVFHCELPPGAYVQTDECVMAVQQCIKALNGWCEAGTHAITVFLKVLKGTVYEQMATQLQGAMLQVRELAGMEMTKLHRNVQTNWCHLSRFSGASNLQRDSSKDNQIVAKELMNFVGSFCQLFLNIAHHLGQFVSYGGDNNGCGSSASEALSMLSLNHQHPLPLPVGSRPGVLGNRSKVVGGSPAGLRKQVTSFLSKIGQQKAADTSCFYVPLDGDGATTSSATPTSQKNSQSCQSDSVQGKSNGHVATQEDLDLVISMLSQRSRVPSSGTQAVPERLIAGQADIPNQLDPAGRSHGPALKPSPPGTTSTGPNLPTASSASNQTSAAMDKISQIGGQPETPASTDLLTKLNTWPFKPNQKLLWPDGVGGDMQLMHNMFGVGDYQSLVKNSLGPTTATTTATQGHHLGTWPVKENDSQRGAGLNNLPNWFGGIWPSVNSCEFGGQWPSQYSMWNTDCLNSLSKSVSTIVESSSGSEESGEQPWIGDSDIPRRRRHSSGEHSLLSQQSTLSNPLVGLNTSVRGSTDDKFGWTNQVQLVEKAATPADDQSLPGGHRALSMQWSDPLTRGTLSYWDSDVLSATKAQVSSAAGNGCYFVKPSTSGGHLDKMF